MPTLNLDSSDIAQRRSRRIVGISLGATLITMLVLFAAMALAPVDADAANTCSLTSTLPTTNWSDTTRWSGCGGTFPGSGAGDTAVISLSPSLINVDVSIPNGVILQLSGSAPVQVASGASLTLESSSTATSSNSFTVISGGTFGIDSGANLSTWQSPVNISGGTFNVLGAISFTNGAQLTVNGGTLQGGGTITIPTSQAATFTGSTSAMTITAGTTLDNFGSLTLTSSANALSINSGATIKNESSGAFGLFGDAPINTDNVASPLINNIGTLAKTGGTTSAINAPLNNSGTVNAGSATIGLAGSGTHSGSFVSGSTTSIAFGGSNTFNSGTSFSGTAPVKFVAGTQTFNASINATGGIKWEGGTIAGTGPLNVSGTSSLNGASSAMTLTGVIVNSGAMTYAPSVITNLLTINGASAKLETTTAAGSFSIGGDYDVQALPAGAGKLRISSGGTVTKSAGTTGSSISAFVDNAASTFTNGSSSPLNIAGGGQSTGSVGASGASSVINVTGGTFDSSGTFTGSGTFNVAGGILNVNTATTFSGAPNLGISSGTLGGTGAVTLTGAGTWSGGTITGSNPFTISSPGSLTLTGASGPMTLDGRTLTNNNQLTFNAATNSLTLKNSATLNNGATMTVSSAGGSIDTDGSSTTFTNTNTGAFSKSSASGIFVINPTFNTGGSVSVSGGVLDIVGAGVSSGSFTMIGSAETWFPTPSSSTYTWQTGTTFSGGKVTVDGPGTVATIAAMTINNTTLDVRGGTFSTPAALTVTAPGAFAWQGGTLTGSGHTIISASTTFDMSTESAARTMSGHTIDNNGNATLVATTQPPSLNDGSTFNNNSGATLSITSDGSIATNANLTNTFNNAGTVQKTSGGNTFTFTAPYAQSAGTMTCADPASTISFNGTGSMSGGSLTASNATCNINFTGGSFTITGGTLSGPGPIQLKGAILNVNAATTFPSIFNMSSGSLGGTQSITIPNAATFKWSGGSITGGAAAPITVSSGGTITADTTTSSLIYDTRPLVINSGGNVNWNAGANAIIFQSGAPVNDSGTFTVSTNGTLGNNAAGSFAVNGQFTYSGSGTLSVTLPLNVQSGGTVTSSGGGNLSMIDPAGVSHAGTFDAQSGSIITFGAGTQQFNAGAAFSNGTGTYKIAGATLNLLTNVSAPNVTLLTGTVSGSGNLTTTSTFAWSGGQMSGSGTTEINGTGSFTTGPLTLNRGLLIGGNTSMNAAGGLSVQTTSAITNNATFTLQNGSVTCTSCTTASFANNGTIQNNAPPLTAWSVPVTGAGLLDIAAGWLQLSANASFNNVQLASGGIAQFGGSANSIGGTVSGAGTLLATGGSTTISGAVTLPTAGSVEVQGGTLTLNGTTTAATLLLTGGTTNGSGNITAASFGWLGGSLSGTGTMTTTGSLVIQGSTGAMTLARNLINNAPSGTYNPPSATQVLTVNAPASVTNNGQFNIFGGFDVLATGAPVFTNAGVLTRTSGSTNAINFGPAVVNAGGTATWSIGATTFTNGYSQTAGTTTLTSATIGSLTPLNFTGGSLNAKGTVNGSVIINGAIFNPGNSAGAVAITGDYTQSSSGILNAEIYGTAAGTLYDQVNVSGNVNLNGTLNATLGYSPASNDIFDVLTYAGTRSGDFTTYNLPTFAGGGSIQKAFVSGSPNLLRLTAIVTQSDLAITQVAPASVLHGQNGTWTLMVTNGPTPVTNVVVTDTFSNAAFFSATSTGPCTPSGSTVTCTLGSLAANQSVNISLTLTASTPGTISNSASVTANEFDPNMANNNVGPATTAVSPAADLSLGMTASSNPVNAGSPLSFSLTVSNAGPDATSGSVSISNTFPSGVTSFTFSGSGWTCGPLSAGVATCTTTTSIAAAGASSLILTMNAPASGPANDSATVSASTGDPNASNNSASQSVTVTPQVDLSITKGGLGTVNAGQDIVYTVTVTNNGPSSAAGVSVADPTPAGLTFVSNSGACTTSYPCALGTLTNGQSATITSTYSTSSGSAGTSVTNTATVSSSTADPTAGNNSASKPTNIIGSADITITKAGPLSSTAGAPLTYTITVTNNGPSDAAAVVVNDATPAGTTFLSNSGACLTPFPCALGTMTAGQSKTITSTFTTAPTFTGTSISNTATVTSTTSDPAANNSATAVTSFGPPSTDLAIVKSGPASATTGSTITYTITVSNNGPATATNVTVSDPTPPGLSFVSAGGSCIGAFPCNAGALTSGQSATITATYNVTAASGSITNTASVSQDGIDPNPGNDTSSVTTTIGPNGCNQQPPALVAPANGTTVSSPVTFSWTAVQGATSYKVFASVGGASTQEIGNTTSTSISLPVAAGTVVWSVQALGVSNCNQLVSANGTFNVCSNAAPVLSVVGTSSAGQSYTVQWTDIGASTYELEESSGDTVQIFPVTGLSKAFTKNAPTPTAFFYRVRALTACGQGPGPYSASERVVVVPIPPVNAQGPSATIDINNKHVVVQTVLIPGQGSAIPFAASTDEPWLTVTPSSGILPADGITLSVSADPADLPNGTFTATIILTFPGAAKTGALDTKPPVSVPISISVVTPVSPATLSTPPANSLIIPSVGHLDGINSQWRSDVRITNTALQKINYLLRFTPAGGDPSQIKQTQVTIASNDTMALDDIVKNWYGVGALGDAANGVLEVRPLNTSGKGAPNAEDVNVSFATIASSRTFNQSSGGTLGQYIPAIPFTNFIGNVNGARAGILSLQQIAQSPAYRTNLGIVEASGKPASVLISVFDTAGKNLLDIPLDLKAGEQQQLNSFLAAKNITLTDGRVEVKVTGGDGKVMAYASVVDNTTTDPLLVTGVPLAQTPARSFILPGVADLNNGLANWRTDLRLFNSGADPQYVTMTLYPQTGSSSTDTIARSFTVNPGEVSVLDNVLASRFGVTNIGGAMHVDTLTDANLVVTGRTYNQIDGGGTYGQFIAAVTPADGVGKGGRTLNVLQVEDSVRYRTNLGIAEVSGKPATVEVSVFLPDAKVAPKVTIPLAANEYRQFRVLQQLGVGTAYNARITIRVIDGDGKITAYGSVIDMQTQDPTYVPAQ